MRTPADNVRFYDHDALWDRSYPDDPHYRAKVRVGGSRPQFAADFPHRAIAAAVDRIEGRLPRAAAFWWLVYLLERTGASEDSIGARQPLTP